MRRTTPRRTRPSIALVVVVALVAGPGLRPLVAAATEPARPAPTAEEQYQTLKRQLPADTPMPKRLERLIKIQNAPTADARRALIRALPVVVTRTIERGGTRVRFAVEGKAERASFFFPTLALPDPPPSDGGPAVPGRWKLGGDGSCYWDEYDGGPDQCTPPGGGGETCYEGEPGPCATQQDMIEAIALGVYSENEALAQEADEAWYEAEINAYCAVNYCGSPEVRPVALGAIPCSMEWPCIWKLVSAVWETGAYLWGARTFLKAANGAAAAGVGLALGTVASSTVLLIGAGVTSGLALGYMAKCYVDTYLLEPVQHQTPLRGILGRRFSVVAA